MPSHRVLLAISVVLILSDGLAKASIINVTMNTGPGFEANTFVYLTPPWGNLSTPADTVGNNNFQNNTTLFAFDEFAGNLSAPVTPDLGPMAVIPAGTPVASHFIFYDPQTINFDVGATIQFDQPILGVIRRTSTLDATDSIFAHPLVNYPTPDMRGLETSDILTIIASDTIRIDWRAGRPGDHIRVITGFVPTSAVIPEPASLALYGLGVGTCILGCVLRKRAGGGTRVSGASR